MTDALAAPEAKKADSKTALFKRRTHEGVTLPSGAVVTIQLPDVTDMIASNALPNHLVEAALREDKPGQDLSNEERIKRTKENQEFVAFIVPHVLVEPKVTEEEVSKLDPRDRDLLAAFATRVTDIDAVGHQLGGLETQRSFRVARGLLGLDEVLEGVQDARDDT